MSLAHYLLQVNIYLVIFYCFYKLLLASETYFLLNRIYLLASGLLSLTIPFLRFEWFGKQEVAKPIYVGVDQFNDFVAQVNIVQDNATAFNWGNFIVLLYLGGILFFSIRLIIKLFTVRKLLKNISNGTAFSFLKKKIISGNVPEIATVNLHEDIHVKQLHTLDILFFELIAIFAWFNPIIYCYKKTIKNIHEYLADEAAARFQGDKEAYALLLLSQAFGIRPHSLTNGFFTKSLIKKRILMLHKQRSKKTAILKYGLFVPLFALTLVLSSATIRKNNQILAMADKIPLDIAKEVVAQAIEGPLNIVNLAPAVSQTSTDTVTTEQQTTVSPTFATTITNEEDNATAMNGFYKYLGERIKYPTSAITKKIQGNTIVNFTVRHGRITDVLVQDELGEGCDEEVVNDILAYNDYLPKDGNYSLKVSFRLNGVNAELKNEDATIGSEYNALQNIVVEAYAPKEEVDVNKVYSFVSVAKPPTYPGGVEKLYEFFRKNIKYPTAAIDNEIQGNVHVSFTVEKDGTLSDIKVERKLGYGTDEEAIRVMKSMKRWNPGIQNGKPIRVKYNIPIRFSLDGGNSDRKANAIAAIRLKNYNEENAPMVIVDNQVKEYNYVKSLNGNNIESIRVLNGPDAIAIYGKTAENGVILIKSKNKPNAITATLTNKN